MPDAPVPLRARLAPWADTWVPDVVAGVLVFLVGFYEVVDRPDAGAAVVVSAGTSIAVALARQQPATALAVVWVVGGWQLLTLSPLQVAEFAVGYVAFATARWGRTGTVVVGGFSIPAAGAIGAAFAFLVLEYGYRAGLDLDRAYTFLESFDLRGTRGVLTPLIAGVGLLGLPWLAGLTVRLNRRAVASDASRERAEEHAARATYETNQAQEIARLRESQAQLANDVHDVVGHSLAVILAQAEAAQYLPDDDRDRWRTTLAAIADSARSSLRDVRGVLEAARDGAPPAPASESLDQLITSLRGSGQQVDARTFGTPRPLPPELATVAYRVLQEMLTNAVKHGRSGAAIAVEQHWPDEAGESDVRLEVRNEAAAAPGDGGGQGLPGMRTRLAVVGGRLDVRRREAARDGEAVTFTVTAWVPVRVQDTVRLEKMGG